MKQRCSGVADRNPLPPPLSVERLEDRLVPGETLGALLLLPLAAWQAAPVAAQTRTVGDDVAADSPSDDSLAAASDPVSVKTDGAAANPAVADDAGIGDAALDVWSFLPAAWAADAMQNPLSNAPAAAVGWTSAASAPMQPTGAVGAAIQPNQDGPPPPSAVPVDAGPASAAAVESVGAAPQFHVRPLAASGPAPYTPAQIRHAYGIDQLSLNGAGQMIAIVDAYNDPTVLKDASVFSAQFGLPQFNVKGGPTLTVVNQIGGAALPAANADWALEISLDVEWAHVVAPQANIALVEANTNSYTDLFAAVDIASGRSHVVSMSWGGSDFQGETSYDYHFNKPGVVFTASSGDNGAGVIYPAASPYVLSVGGTNLPLDAHGNRIGPETAWTGSGGGVSANEGEPGYQAAYKIVSRGRVVPDVSYNADPNTGFYVFDSTPYAGQSGWWDEGGTSAGAPQWAGLTALANQGRQALGKLWLSGAAPDYGAAVGAAYAADYTDVAAGSNGTGAHTTATIGYDYVTGLGSPLANGLVPYLVAH